MTGRSRTGWAALPAPAVKSRPQPLRGRAVGKRAAFEYAGGFNFATRPGQAGRAPWRPAQGTGGWAGDDCPRIRPGERNQTESRINRVENQGWESSRESSRNLSWESRRKSSRDVFEPEIEPEIAVPEICLESCREPSRKLSILRWSGRPRSHRKRPAAKNRPNRAGHRAGNRAGKGAGHRAGNPAPHPWLFKFDSELATSPSVSTRLPPTPGPKTHWY